MVKNRLKQFIGISIIILFTTNSSFLFASDGEAIEPYFTLVFKTNGGGVRPDYGNLLKQQLARIGINVDVIIQDWPTFVGELIAYRDFDICYVGLTGDGSANPDFTGVYNVNGSLNLFGYDTSMDYNETLGTGLNEWYMKEGRQILPAYSQERLEHYWAWQQHLMDNLLPCLPTFVPKIYTAYWSNLEGYNMSDGLLQSWGKMSWDGNHLGQTNTNEVVISDAAWSDLTPFYQDDTSSSFISDALMDTMIYYDTDMTPWPHLATNWTHITDTQVRVKLREGIKWQPDYEGNFTNEYFDAEDVYFSYTLCDRIVGSPCAPWLDHMEIVDDHTIDFFIDGNDYEPGAQPSTLYLESFERKILPEHYLNQTQFPDGSPDITHESWRLFATKAFGTGLFSLTHFEQGEETILTVNPECWRLNTSITSDPALEWERRFGDFAGGLNQLRIRIIPNQQTALLEFEAGKTDIQEITQFSETRKEMIASPDFAVQNDITFYFGFFGYNMCPVRPVIGNPDDAPGDASMTVGLAVRKAISYAIDLEEMNNIIHGGEYAITYHPIYMKLGIWCNPNIIKYEHNLSQAIEYMTLAGGYTPTNYTSKTGINWIYSLSGIFILLGIQIIIRKKIGK